MTIYGYARCSTNENKQDINRQKRDLKALGGVVEKNIYWEYESGTKVDRVTKHYPKYREGQINKAEFAKICGVSRQSIYKYLRIYEE